MVQKDACRGFNMSFCEISALSFCRIKINVYFCEINLEWNYNSKLEIVT